MRQSETSLDTQDLSGQNNPDNKDHGAPPGLVIAITKRLVARGVAPDLASFRAVIATEAACQFFMGKCKARPGRNCRFTTTMKIRDKKTNEVICDDLMCSWCGRVCL